MSDIDTVRDEIAAEFAKTGNATVALVDLNMTLHDWRKVARSAARQLGRPVETVANETRAWASLRNWPANKEEQDKHDVAMRAAMNSIATLVLLRTGPIVVSRENR